VAEQLDLPLDYCLFWLPAMHFFLNEVRPCTKATLHMMLPCQLPTSLLVPLWGSVSVHGVRWLSACVCLFASMGVRGCV